MDKKNKVTKITKGGPDFFMEKVLKKHNVKYSIHVDKAKIMIRVNGEEKGKLNSKLREKKIKNINSKDIVIISTVDREWILDDSFDGMAKVFLDVQGYIRSAAKDPSIYTLKFWNKIACIKGNRKEISKLPRKIVDRQKKKLLIVTKGDEGSTIYFKNKKYLFRAKKIKTQDTIGAGDTFFANLIISLLVKRNDIIQSGNFATRETEKFLVKKI